MFREYGTRGYVLGSADATAPVTLENADLILDAACGAGIGSGVGRGAGSATGPAVDNLAANTKTASVASCMVPEQLLDGLVDTRWADGGCGFDICICPSWTQSTTELKDTDAENDVNYAGSRMNAPGA